MTRILLFILAVGTFAAEGSLVREIYSSTRANGMGNAFIALSDDASMLWYNPANLARVRGGHVHLVDASFHFDTKDTLTRISNAAFKGDSNNLIRPGLQQMGLAVRPTFISKYFGISFFDNVKSFTDFRDLNTLSASVDVYSFNDVGAILGVGFPFSDFLSLGASVRVFQRSVIDTTLDTQTLLSQIGISTTDFQGAISDYLKTLVGFGWAVGANFGATVRLPVFAKGGPDWTASLLVENVGRTKFRRLGSQNNLPDDLPMTYHLGTAFRYPVTKNTEFNLTADFRHMFEKIPATKKLHFGAEYRGVAFDLRAGMNQLYPTAGFGLKFPPHTRLNFTTYAVELGDNALERSQRLYEIQVVLGFNPF